MSEDNEAQLFPSTGCLITPLQNQPDSEQSCSNIPEINLSSAFPVSISCKNGAADFAYEDVKYAVALEYERHRKVKIFR